MLKISGTVRLLYYTACFDEHLHSMFNLERDTYQIIIWADAKKLSKVSESNWCVCFEPEVGIMVSWGEVTAFTARGTDRWTQNQGKHYVCSYDKVTVFQLFILEMATTLHCRLVLIIQHYFLPRDNQINTRLRGCMSPPVNSA